MKRVIAFILILASVITISSCYRFEDVNPMPALDRNEVMYVKTYDKVEQKYNRKWDADIDVVFDYLERATPYRNSDTDSVYGEEWRAILIRMDDGVIVGPTETYTYFVYKDRFGRTFVEAPYNFIYKVDPGLFDYLDGLIYPNKK
jgi:hypothetical protein